MASIEVTDIQSEKRLGGHTTNISLFGCFVSSANPFPEGTKVRLRISHGGTSFAALGKVVFSRQNSGMGISFTTIESTSQATLETWLATLRAE